MPNVDVVPGTVFSNGTEYEVFNEAFCCRCNKYKLDADGWPLSPSNGGCAIWDNIESAALGYPFPSEDVVSIKHDGKIKYWHVCRGFDTDDEEIKRSYLDLFKGVRGE